MKETDRAFRQRLLNVDQITPALQQRYHKEIETMLEKPLTGFRRWGWLGSAVLGITFTVVFGTVAIAAPTEFPWWGRIAFAAGALFGIGWAILGIRIFRRGSMHLKKDTGAAMGMTWGFLVLMMTLFMVFASNDIVGVRMIVNGLVFLVMGIAFLLRHVIEQSELKTREKLLEIEYRLAELAEAVQPKKSEA
jgi:hypothetical protein